MPDVIAVWREHHHDAHHCLVGPTEVETQILNLKLRTARGKSLCKNQKRTHAHKYPEE
jgi:hypothetical protein